MSGKQEAEEEDGGDGDDAEGLAGAVHEGGGGDAGQGHHRGNGKVDAAGNDDHRLARDREDEGQRGADQRAEAVGAVVRLDDPGEDEERGEQDRETDDPGLAAEGGAHAVAPGRGAAAPGARRGRP